VGVGPDDAAEPGRVAQHLAEGQVVDDEGGVVGGLRGIAVAVVVTVGSPDERLGAG
jgi:hypothetical protein